MMYQFAQLRHQGVSNPAHSMMNKGGGGSAPSNPDTRYANLDALYGTQNQASQFMLDNAMPYIPTLTQNSAGMVQEAMDGTLANQLVQRAGNDAAATMGSALDANNRNMQRYGMGMSANRMLSEGNRNAIMGAGMKAGEMNKARLGAEDMKWNRNANFYGQVMGMNNGAMQGMSNAGTGLSNIANQQSANDRANAAGYGQAGAAFSNALFKADGGIIEGKAVRLADGGDAWEAYKAANPVRPMVSGGGSRRSSGTGFNQFIAGAAPYMLGAGLRDIMNLDGKGGKIAKGAKDAYKWAAGKMAPTGGSSISMQGAPEYANAQLQPVDMTGFEPGADMMAGANATGAATEMGSAAMDTANAGLAAGEGATAAYALTEQALGSAPVVLDAASTGISGASYVVAAKGGYIKKSKKGAQCLAMGGMPSMQKMSVADNANVAGLDSNSSLSLAKMDDMPAKQVNAKPTGNAPGYWGNTDGMGETSYGDEDGFGKYHGDNRHLAGNIAMTVFGGYPGLGTLAHPIAEPMTRAMISTGDKVGGVTGAILMDPIGTSMSGKYKPEDIAKGNLAIALGVPWAGKFLADGGEARIDYTPGGKVSGPGTETSDDIPAWLSDGEYVLNAEAVKMVGKKKLDKINKAGLKKRGDEDAKPGLKDADLALGSGGFANLGIAMGAGVDQWNRQQMIDQRNQELEMRKQEAEQRRQEYEYQRQQREANAQAQAGARSAMEDATAMAGLPEQLRNRTKLDPTHKDYLSQEDANNALRTYREKGYTPEALAKKAGLELGKVDIGRGMELQNKLIAQQQAERRARVGGLLGAGDYAGLADVMSNNDFNPDGKAYKFTGVEKGKDGNEYVRFNVNGVDQRVDKRMLPGLVEASLDPSKGIEYTREVGKITDQDADRKIRNRQADTAAGHLGLANSKWAMEKEELTTERKVKAKIRELRESLSNTKDEAEREAIKLKIADLSGGVDGKPSIHMGSLDSTNDTVVSTNKDGSVTARPLREIVESGKKPASNFEIGKVYADAAGNKAKWNGKSWEPVK